MLGVMLCACERSQVARTGGEHPRAVGSPAPSLSVTQRRDLQRDLDKILAAGGLHSLCVLDERGERIYDRDATAALAPASTQKLIVAAAVLRDLGPKYSFTTTIASLRRLEHGVVRGDLWLIGSGDPVLVANDLRGGVKVLAREGLRRVAGRVRVDASFLEGPERNPFWEPTDAQYGFSAATSGISLDQDTIEVHVTPRRAGLAARISLEPPSGIVTLQGSVQTVAAGGQTNVGIVPAGAANAFVISGEVAAGGRATILYVPVTGIPQYVGAVLTTMLRKRGISVTKPTAAGVAPKRVLLFWRHRSPPLTAIVHKMLFESNNHLAEQLLRTLGRTVHGEGTDSAGIAAEREALRALQIPIDGLRLVDASGLSTANRLSALTLAALLHEDQRRGGGLYQALPRAGIEGTVKYYRLGGARGRVRAKSGHLGGIEALAGYAVSRRYGKFSFAFVFATTDDAADVDARIARAVERLAEF